MKKFSSLRLFVVGILSFIAVYLSEITLGVIATVPFLVIIPPVCYLIYKHQLRIVGLFALAGFFFKLVFVSDIKSALFFALFCALFAALSITALKLINIVKSADCKKKKKYYGISGIIFIVLFLIYFIIYGTFFGNLSSKHKNISYLEARYPEEEFISGNTYFSVSDFSYVTEFLFLDNELYTVKISAENDENAKIDGYRDYCVSRLSEVGLSKIRAYLSNYTHEGEDFALRNGDMLTEDTLYPTLSPESYFTDMCYEIAFYEHFESREDFENSCKQYLSYIPEEFEYNKISFYGLSDKGKFKYAAEYCNTSDTFTSSDNIHFKKYFSQDDTHKYWSVIK